MKPSIFGAYGIRGVWGETLTRLVVRDITTAFVDLIQPKQVVCGRDARVSSSEIQAMVIETLLKLGVNVLDVGLVPVDALDFAVANLKVDGGILVTASHNPPKWNGLKLRRAQAVTIVGMEMKEIERQVAEHVMPQPGSPGHRIPHNIIPAYTDMVVRLSTLARPLSIVVDPGNGATIPVITSVLDRLGVKWSGIHMEPDGLFPGRGPDPKLPGALGALSRAVTTTGADVGVAFDADGDRMFLVDERGRPLYGETTGILIARHVLKTHPGSTFLYNVVCSRAVPELIMAAGGRAIRIGVGSMWTLPALHKHQAVMGIETSGHYIQRELNSLDSGIVPMVLALNAISSTEKPLSKLVADLDPYFHEFIDLPADDVQAVLATYRTAFSDGKQDELDGLTVEFPTWWFNARPSNTEPLLRLTVEANTKEEMVVRREELLKLIRGT